MLLGASEAPIAALPKRSEVLGAEPPPALGRSYQSHIAFEVRAASRSRLHRLGAALF